MYLMGFSFAYIALIDDVSADEVAIRLAKKQTIDIEKHKKILLEAEKFLSGFDTLYSKFIESSSQYAVVNIGKISISRPGKMKIEYLKPEKSVLIMKDDKVVYYDKELDSVSYGDVENNPLEILLYKNVSLWLDSRLTRIENSKNTLEIQISPEIPNALRGDFSEFLSVVLVFEKNPMRLVRVRKIDVNNHSVNIQLIDPQYNVKFPKNAFPYSNPRGDKINKKR